VLRGGSWHNNNSDKLMAAYRNNDKLENQNNNIGLRLAEHLNIAGVRTSKDMRSAQIKSRAYSRPPIVWGQIKIAWFWQVNRAV